MKLKKIIKTGMMLTLAGILTTGCATERMYKKGYIQGAPKEMKNNIKTRTVFGIGAGVDFIGSKTRENDPTTSTGNDAFLILNAHGRIYYKGLFVEAGVPTNVSKYTHLNTLKYTLTQDNTTTYFYGPSIETFRGSATPYADIGYAVMLGGEARGGFEASIGLQQYTWKWTTNRTKMTNNKGQYLQEFTNAIETTTENVTGFTFKFGFNLKPTANKHISIYLIGQKDYIDGKPSKLPIFKGIGITIMSSLHTRKKIQ